MSFLEAIMEGTIQPDGTLVLDQPTKLPAGRVQVIVQALPQLPEGDPFWDMMRAIWAEQAIERLQEESRRIREQR